MATTYGSAVLPDVTMMKDFMAGSGGNADSRHHSMSVIKIQEIVFIHTVGMIGTVEWDVCGSSQGSN